MKLVVLMIRCCAVVVLGVVTLFAVRSQAGILAQFRTFFGDIEVELFEKDKPITVNNFLRYVQSGRYRDSFFHRCPTNHFLIQGGGYFVTNRGLPTGQLIEFIDNFGQIRNEYGAGTIYSNSFGTLAMAKEVPGQTNSASSQWFFNLQDNFDFDTPDTNNSFTVFGRVIAGTEILDIFRTFQPWKHNANETNIIADLREIGFGPDFRETPFLTGLISYDNLLYVDISVLNVRIRRLANAQEISWTSIADRTNRVQFTTNFPPVWNSLLETNGNGVTMTVQDGSGAKNRFYRVTVDF